MGLAKYFEEISEMVQRNASAKAVDDAHPTIKKSRARPVQRALDYVTKAPNKLEKLRVQLEKIELRSAELEAENLDLKRRLAMEQKHTEQLSAKVKLSLPKAR